MIDHVWSIICTQTIIDQETNNISLLNAIESLTISDNPKPGGVLPIHIELVTLWIRKEATHTVEGEYRVNFVAPSGKSLIEEIIKIDLSKRERTRNRIIFQGLPLEESGRYCFNVEQNANDDWIRVATIPLIVVFTPKEKEALKGEEIIEIN
jgi:hypothetical protein